jgi:hypothetical protein
VTESPAKPSNTLIEHVVVGAKLFNALILSFQEFPVVFLFAVPPRSSGTVVIPAGSPIRQAQTASSLLQAAVGETTTLKNRSQDLGADLRSAMRPTMGSSYQSASSPKPLGFRVHSQDVDPDYTCFDNLIMLPHMRQSLQPASLPNSFSFPGPASFGHSAHPVATGQVSFPTSGAAPFSNLASSFWPFQQAVLPDAQPIPPTFQPVSIPTSQPVHPSTLQPSVFPNLPTLAQPDFRRDSKHPSVSDAAKLVQRPGSPGDALKDD